MNDAQGSCTVVLADDHPLMREGLRRSLEAFGLQIVAEAGDGRAAVSAVELRKPDVALLDLWMPSMDGIRATEIIKARHPEVKVVLLTFDTDEVSRERAHTSGADLVLTKDTEAEALVEQLLAPRVGSVRPCLVSPDDEGLTLSPREVEVLRQIVAGASTPAIASSLFISAKTVKNHLASIYAKLDVVDRTQAVLTALRLGLLSLDEAEVPTMTSAGCPVP